MDASLILRHVEFAQMPYEVWQNEPTAQPPGDTISFRYWLDPGTWLVHATDSAYDIAREGFRGAVSVLALTTHQRDMDLRSPGEGYVFAVTPDRAREVVNHSRGGYGAELVAFRADGAGAYEHYGDRQTQIIVPAGCTYDHVPLFRVYDAWLVSAEDAARGLRVRCARRLEGREFEFDDVEAAVEWLDACKVERRIVMPPEHYP